MYEVYSWDDHSGSFRIHGSFTHLGAAEAVAGRLTKCNGTPHLVRFRAA